MNTYKTLIAAAVLGSLMVGCASTVPHTAPLQVAPVKVMSNIPDWYINPPESDQDALYVVGTSISRDLAMSVQKAQLDAETHLASKIAGEVSSLTKDYKREVGDEYLQSTEIVTNKLTAEVKVIGGVVAKKEIIPEGGGFRTYVMMKYPIGSNNKLQQLYDAKKAFTGSKEKAEAELDRKVAEKREPHANATVTPVVDTSNPFVVVKVTPAADAAEEN